MKQVFSFLLIILFFNFSCNRSKSVQEVSENSDSLKVSSNRIVNMIGETLNPVAKKAVSEWKEYENVDEFIIKYYNISTSEALDYAEELSGLVQLMKDSVRVELLQEMNITARFNVLHSEALRLADMATIPSITNKEVIEEVGKIVEVYSAVNAKINTIYKAEELQNSLEVDTETPNLTLEEEGVPKRKIIKNRKPLIKEELERPEQLGEKKLRKLPLSRQKKIKQ